MSANPIRNLPDVLFQAVEQSPNLVTITDPTGTIEYVNPAFCRLTGHTLAELAGHPIHDLKSGAMPESTYAELWRQLRAGNDWHGEFHNRKKNGDLYWERAAISAIRDAHGGVGHYLKVAEDITRQKELEHELQQAQRQRENLLEQLRHASVRDPLTGLFNRRGFEAEINRAWQLGIRQRQPTGILVMDLDHFKSINDTYGHLVGDQVLAEASRLVADETRTADIACRYGGDELLVILPLTGLEETRRAAERLCAVFQSHVFCRGAHDLHVTLSIGAAACTADGVLTAQRLLARADQALYCAKLSGRNRVCCWEPGPAADTAPIGLAATPGPAGAEEPGATLRRALAEVRQSYRAILEMLAAVLEAREHKTSAHSRRVAQMACVLAREMGLGEDEVDLVGQGALMHDIGKVAIPDEVLLKKGPLSEEEWTLMKSHPRLGYEIVRTCPALERVAEIVYTHQERYDGSGYPRGLQGEAICLEARIFAVVDAYDAIRSRRSYSAGQDAAAAAAEIARQRGSQFDPRVVDAFQRCFARIEAVAAADAANAAAKEEARPPVAAGSHPGC